MDEQYVRWWSTMVKVAFVVEGKVEQIFVDSLERQGWFKNKGLQKVGPTIDAKGGGNLCPANMPFFVEQAKVHKPDKIFILTDLECDPCVTKTKERLGLCDECVIVLAKKAIEAWFLADNILMSSLTQDALFSYEYPEQTTDMPYDVLKELLLTHTKRGTGSKVGFVKRVFKSGFSVESAANHPNCQSVSYFIDKIDQLGGS